MSTELSKSLNLALKKLSSVRYVNLKSICISSQLLLCSFC